MEFHMKLLVLTALLASSISASLVHAQEVTRTPLLDGHPLIGLWRIELKNSCFEEYDIRADGTKISQSGEERNESDFEISPEPSSSGFFKWTDKITKNNAKPDCGGSIGTVGHVAVNFVRLHPSGQRFLLCEAQDMRSCFAEFHRKGRSV